MAAQMAVNSGASLWGPLKELWETVDGAVLKKQPDSVHLLDLQLKKHKPHFLSLFKNPPKSAEQREKVRKASTEGIAIQGQQGSRLLPEQLLSEAFILSDLFDIGELAALELLLAGEQQQPYFPGLTRGLVAVLLYWDGKLCVARSLQTLIQSRHGKTFTLDLSEELVALTTRFTDELMTQGLTKRILTLVSEINVTREFERLQKERGLGNEKHRKEVSDLINECRQVLADSLFSWTCQSPLTKDDTLALIGHLETVTAQADGSLGGVNLALVMSLLYCLDVSFVEQGTEDREDLLHALPLLTDKQYVAAVHNRLMDGQPWKLPGLQAVCRLAWALSLRVLSQLPQGSALVEFTEADEALADQALLGDVFLFMKEGMLGCESFSQEEFYIRRLHSLITDFLALMPMKVKQLRNRADEDARLVHMSLQMDSELPSSLRKDLDHLMNLIGEFYNKDFFGLELGLEFWCPTESLQHTSLQGSYLGMALQRPPHKQVVLSKFVRQMGDLLPSTLYISYLHMLKGLANGPQCAHYCFSLLKTNGATHGDNIQGVSGSPVSWEHFFHSLMLYHENLRRDLPNPDAAHYRHHLRGITQRELEGLTSFLQLLTTIITWSENARLALCEHPQWTPVIVMLGLLQCSVPPVLKAELLHCLAAFGKSPEIAASLWQSLEYTQILQTVRAPGQRQAAGIEVELNEIESSCEEYPLARGFCHLISTLVESSLPINLGAGLRVPGFQPYLNFMRDSVFLPFPTRAYRRPAEKWEVADSALEVFHKLLRDYEPQPSDFVQEMLELQGEQVPAYKPPGHSIMFHLLNDSPMLALCLSLLEEGVRQLDTYAPFPGKKQLESAVLHCLCLLDLALQKEVVFMDLLRESQASLLVSPLEQLLQGVSPQTRRADHIVTIARFLYHGVSNPEAAFQSANILRRIANYPNIQLRLVGDFTHDQTVSDKLMAGFVQCLDNEEAEEGTENEDDSDQQKKMARIRHKTQIHILNLLITSLELKAPNLALYLLGYEVKKPVSSTNLQDPGVLGCPRSCLHAILSLLQRGTEKRTGPVLTKQAPHLAELCYQVIYQLCACPDTSGPTMRYLRTSQDFLFSHLQHLPFILPSNQIAALSQMSWLMKTAAIELRVTSLNRQRSHTQRLVSLLLDDQPHTQHTADGESGMEEETRSVSGFLHFDTVSKVRRKLLSVLDAINFSQEMPELLQLDFFERAQIEQVISNCEHVNEQGHTVCNVKLLHRVLVAEVNALQGMAAIGQRPMLMEEVNSILHHVVERNCVRRSLSAKRHALQSWRSLVETLLTACPADLIPADDRQLIIRDLLLDLHDKVLSDDAAGELMPIVAGAVFTLTAHLSQSVLSEQQQGVGLETSSGFASIANSALHLILRKLLDFILSTGGGYQRLRAHLYGSLLYYLQIAQKPEEPDTLQTAGKAMWERLTAPEDGFSKLQRENLAIIESYGTSLIEVVCRDACDGHEISRMLALAVLDRILSIDRQNQWLVYVCNSGYLRSLVESLRHDDVALQTLLTPQPPLLKPLYIYESKMALMTRVAKTGQGAVELLRCGLVSQLMECQVFDMVPDSDAHRMMRDASGFIPSPMDRYRQILLPTLRLFQVILTSTTMDHQQGATQVLQWLIVHADTIQSLLRCHELSMGTLQELSLLTGIISKTALPGALEVSGEVNSAALMEFQGHINRFQRLCLSLLGCLVGSERERLLKQAEISAPGESAERREDMEVAMQQVCANIMEYCQALLLQSSTQAQFSICLFSPSGSEPAGRDGGRTDLSSTLPSLAYSRAPGLGLVLYLLKSSAADFFRFHQSHRQSLSKLQSLDQLPPEELKELCQGLVSGPGGVEKISSVQRSLLAKRRLVQLINNRAKLLALCSYVIETCLFVLWRHLEYYLLHCTPTDPKDSLLTGASLSRSRFTDDSFGGLQLSGSRGLSLSRVSQQDLDLLKSDMAAGFGEALQRKLLEVEGLYSQVRSRYTFIQALVRRIRGLLRQPKT
ncbi:nuclear pore complex protein Nup205 [Solea senegalensis]|uniref:Nuclear pore complex protein Nup205 n=3 Tax=Solea senegalensis TaxID=28829 RepID=A0AAV6SZA0_SOLSE|nr:nuclear pore complex protein Nup205 [Solea senegalensis]KAG7522445.1 nuclear pore complex protein Nup205 [Solea senegalensis]